jgi:hypothetical protein
MYVAAKSLTRRFLHQIVIVDVPECGAIAGVLLAASSSLYGPLVLGVLGGPLIIIRSWFMIKSARSHV